jgi:hypothetical protein
MLHLAATKSCQTRQTRAFKLAAEVCDTIVVQNGSGNAEGGRHHHIVCMQQLSSLALFRFCDRFSAACPSMGQTCSILRWSAWPMCRLCSGLGAKRFLHYQVHTKRHSLMYMTRIQTDQIKNKICHRPTGRLEPLSESGCDVGWFALPGEGGLKLGDSIGWLCQL